MKPEPSQPESSSSARQPGLAGHQLQKGVGDLAPSDSNESIQPREDHPPLSLWLVAFAGAVLFWGGIYLQRYSGGYAGMVYNENVSGLGAGKTNVVAPVDPYALGRRLFADTCAKCHQPDGHGVSGQYPPLVGSEWVLASGPTRMIRIVLDALQGPVKVKGVDFNNTMTPWRDTLTDQQIAAVITYVRTQKDWGNRASPVTPAEVAEIRKKTKDRSALGPWTVPELLAIPEHEPQP
jgi:mono/diheme cytochrome c family protein